MSELERLMQELCPNGVEYVVLNDICNVYDGTHQTPNYTESGVKFVSVENINALYDTKKYISAEDFESYKIKPRKNDVLMTRIGSIGICAVVDKDEPLAYYVSLALLRPDLTRLNSKYLKYIIESKYGRKELRKRTLVNAVPIKVNMGDIGKISIPVPPLEIQREIVRILDNFTEITDELSEKLEAELTARKKQYEFYRKFMLIFDSTVPFVSIGDVCDVATGGEPPADCIKGYACDEQHPYAVWGNGKELYGYSNTYRIDRDSVVISSIGANTGAVYFRKAYFTPIIRLKVVIPKDDTLDVRYLFHALSATEINSKSSSVPNMNANEIKKIKIPFPKIQIQKNIADILDRFDSLCNDLSAGLPAEIEARQKQYEYYRDKLLSF